MSEWLKYFLIAVVVMAQLGGIVLIFVNVTWAIWAFSVYGIGIVILIAVFIVERWKEKREEIDYDDCDY
ncbi:hypothetical protein [Halalkalibacter krulwichiae]|uniref:Uncharacterized protein n=1 Tax=Halalkalibacter krulwichiae TaxID=199441 RepID=A0A1Y9THR7_9BACI|nr:hypothetical protein [Halalkalibacter krulwichiae]ARK28718.1 hypothetical protein BkAM31D_02010 [Halalkalibacter krulwichiae]